MPRPARSSAFAGKVAFVTGGASGIGAALVRGLLDHGARLVVADVDEAALAELHHGAVRTMVLDVRDSAAFAAAVDSARSVEGRLDLLFNNAGIVSGGPTERMTLDEWDRILDVNLRGVIHGIAAAYPTMVAQGSGQIVNTASAAGVLPSPFAAAYSASKHAVVGLSGALRAEARLHGVGVTVLCPGMVETPILDRPASTDPGGSSFTGRAYLAAAGMKPIPPDRFATVALKGVARNRATVIAPASVRMGVLLGRTFPGPFAGLTRITTGRVRAAMDRADP